VPTLPDGTVVPDQDTVRHFLARLGVLPQDAGYDRLQREASDWFAAGGSLTSFVEQRSASRAEALEADDRRGLSWQEAMRRLREKYVPPA
jgi:hypothetical protein